MTALVYAIISGPEHGWTSGQVLSTAAVAVVVLVTFAYWESRIPDPVLDLYFFRDRRFTGAVAGAVLITFGMGGALFPLTRHLQFVLGYDALEAGLRTAPLALVVVALNFSGLPAKWTAGPRFPAPLKGAPRAQDRRARRAFTARARLASSAVGGMRLLAEDSDEDWRDQLRTLAEQYQAVLVRHPGCRRSSAPSSTSARTRWTSRSPCSA